MDTFVDSSWYYMRYCSPDSADAMVDSAQRLLDADGPVHRRHRARGPAPAVRALLDQGDARPRPGEVRRAVQHLLTQGMVLNELYYREDAAGRKRWFYPAEIDIEHDDKGRPAKVTAREDGQPVTYGGIDTMSKSKNNVVDPQRIIERYGADTARVFMMFASPPDQTRRGRTRASRARTASCAAVDLRARTAARAEGAARPLDGGRADRGAEAAAPRDPRQPEAGRLRLLRASSTTRSSRLR